MALQSHSPLPWMVSMQAYMKSIFDPACTSAGSATSSSMVPLLTSIITHSLTTMNCIYPQHDDAQFPLVPVKKEMPMFYLYTVLPEKAKWIWVVFFSNRRHDLEPFELLLQETARIHSTKGDNDNSNSPPHPLPLVVSNNHASSYLHNGSDNKMSLVIPALPKLSWVAKGTHPDNGRPLYQHKVCFPAPDTTFARTIFTTVLFHRTECAMTSLGALSLVSTTSQRQTIWPCINQFFLDPVQRQLIANCQNHPASRRHFVNGKGATQGTKYDQKERFLLEELKKAISLPMIFFQPRN